MQTPAETTRPDDSVPGSDAKLRAQSETILRMPVGERLAQLEAEAQFVQSVQPSEQ